MNCWKLPIHAILDFNVGLRFCEDCVIPYQAIYKRPNRHQEHDGNVHTVLVIHKLGVYSCQDTIYDDSWYKWHQIVQNMFSTIIFWLKYSWWKSNKIYFNWYQIINIYWLKYFWHIMKWSRLYGMTKVMNYTVVYFSLWMFFVKSLLPVSNSC